MRSKEPSQINLETVNNTERLLVNKTKTYLQQRSSSEAEKSKLAANFLSVLGISAVALGITFLTMDYVLGEKMTCRAQVVSHEMHKSHHRHSRDSYHPTLNVDLGDSILRMRVRPEQYETLQDGDSVQLNYTECKWTKWARNVHL
jgi:hypothetical protein